MSEIRELHVDLLYPNPLQPRKVFDQEALRELAESIKSSGLMQPVTVVLRPSDHGDFLIVAGERRWRAHKLASLTTIQAIVRELNDEQVAELALIENLLRRDLNDMEEARAYQSMIDGGHTVKSLAKLLGHADTARVSGRLSLLNLDQSLQDGMTKGAITFSQGLAMSRLTVEGQFTLWRAIQDGKCNTPGKLRRLAAAMLDRENQVDLFATKPLTAAEQASLNKVDRLIADASALLTAITADDLKLLENLMKSDANVCIDRLNLLAKTCYAVANALQTAQMKQEAAA